MMVLKVITMIVKLRMKTKIRWFEFQHLDASARNSFCCCCRFLIIVEYAFPLCLKWYYNFLFCQYAHHVAVSSSRILKLHREKEYM